MKKLIALITSYLDVISNETNIVVKDKKGRYYEPESILIELSKVWNELSGAKRNRISKAYMDSRMGYCHNKEKYDNLLTKTIKLPLSALIEPIDNIPDEHIIYDRNNNIFMLSTESTNENLINCWHFGAISNKSDEVLYLLKNLDIARHTKLLKFLLQQVEFSEFFLHILS